MLNLLHHNAHSLLPKLSDYLALPFLQSYNFLSFNETWYNSKLPDTLVALPNFNVFRADRRDGRMGGGVALYVKDTLRVSILQHLPSLLTSCDSVWLKIRMADQFITVASIYLPPPVNKKRFLEELLTVLQDPSIADTQLVIAKKLQYLFHWLL